MTKQATDCAWSSGAVSTRSLFGRTSRSKTATPRCYRGKAMPGETRRAVFAQPDWLRVAQHDRRLPKGARVVLTGCGTSFHAAQTGGWAVQSLEAVLRPPEADLMVVVSHEGGTALAVEAARAFFGPKWLVTGAADSPLADLAD